MLLLSLVLLFLAVLSSLLHGLFSIVLSGGYSSLQRAGFSLQGLLSLWSMGSRACTCRWLWLLGSRAQARFEAHRLSCRVGSSQTRDRIHVSCTGRQILDHLNHQGSCKDFYIYIQTSNIPLDFIHMYLLISVQLLFHIYSVMYFVYIYIHM